MLGIDLDDDLIKCASKKHKGNEQLSFIHSDLMEEQCEEQLFSFVSQFKSSNFNFVFCFSVSMWIHLHHGDEGMKTFFKRIAKLGDFLVRFRF